MNEELTIKVLTRIEQDRRNPEAEWSLDQDVWFHIEFNSCGSTACFAGYTTLVMGLQPQGMETVIDGENTPHSVEDAAQHALRLAQSQATDLFYNTEDLDGIYRRCAKYLELDEQVLRDKVLAEVGVM